MDDNDKTGPDEISPFVLAENAAQLTAFGGQTLDRTNPVSVALHFSGAVKAEPPDIELLNSLVANPADWEESWNELATMLDGYGLSDWVKPAEDRPDDLVYMRFVEVAGDQPVVTYRSAMVWSYPLTLIRARGEWLVWGVGQSEPPASEVFRDR